MVEYTAGTPGISLALVCAAGGYGLEIVYSDAFSGEKRRTMEAFGAHVTDVPSDDRKINEALVKQMIATALGGPGTGGATSSTITTRLRAPCRGVRSCGIRPKAGSMPSSTV